MTENLYVSRKHQMKYKFLEQIVSGWQCLSLCFIDGYLLLTEVRRTNHFHPQLPALFDRVLVGFTFHGHLLLNGRAWIYLTHMVICS